MKHKGPSTRREGKKGIKRTLDAMKVIGGEKMKVRKERVDKGVVRGRQQEAIDRPIIMRRMRKDGWVVKRVEPYGSGKFALGDLWIHHPRQRMMGWGEVKSLKGQLSQGQKDFRDACGFCGVNYWVVRICGSSYSMTKE